jgi:transposase
MDDQDGVTEALALLQVLGREALTVDQVAARAGIGRETALKWAYQASQRAWAATATIAQNAGSPPMFATQAGLAALTARR